MAVAVAGPTILLKKNMSAKGLFSGTGVSLGIPQAFAVAAPTNSPPPKTQDACFAAFNAVIAATPANGTYTDGLLDHVHSQIYRLNSIQSADVEMVFCRLSTVMGVNPNIASLTSTPQVTVVTDPLGNTITLSLTAPTEAFAILRGYTAKAVVASGTTTFMTLWWSGNTTTSKGYLIQGSNPMESDGNVRLRYALWDRSGVTTTLKILAAQYASTGSYLASVAPLAVNTQTGGDNAAYAELSYNTSTKAFTMQGVEIRAGSVAGTTTLPRCVKTYTTGTIGGTISGFRPAQGTPELVTSTTLNGANMDGETGIVDSKTTADHSGSPVAGLTGLPNTTFSHSCADIYGAGTAASPFNPFSTTTTGVSYTTVPSAIFTGES